MLIGCEEGRGLQIIYIYISLSGSGAVEVRPGCDEQILLRRYGLEMFSASWAFFLLSSM
jgi:hypothetical protein